MIIIEKFKEIKNQLLVILIGNICSFNTGLQTGWLAPIFGLLRSKNSPLSTGPITPVDQSWIGGSLMFGMFIGPFICSRISNRFGRKIGMLSLSIPMTVGVLLLIFKKSVASFMAFRMIYGLAVGGGLLLIPLMVTEISDDHIRGTFGSILTIFQYFGMLLGNIIGSYVPFNTIPYILLINPLLLFCGLIFMPESPIYLYKINNRQKAEKSLKFYKNCANNDEKFRLEKTKVDLMILKLQEGQNTRITTKDMFNISAIKGFTIGITITAMYLSTVVYALSLYTSVIFQNSGSTLDPNESTIFCSAIQFTGAVFAAVLCDRIGRKILLIASLTGCVIGQFTLGLFVYFGLQGFNISPWSWTSVASLSLIMFATSFGVAPLRHILSLELVSPKLRSAATILNNTTLCFGQFTVLLLFPTYSEEYGLHITMWFFCVVCFLGIIFCALFIEETKNKDVNT